VRDARRLEQLRVDARRSEAGNRVQLVDEHLAVLTDEAVGARHPLALRRDERLDRESLDPSGLLAGDPRRDDELHPALVVLRAVVVPLRVRDDLAGDGRDWAAVAEHAALDLDSADELL